MTKISFLLSNENPKGILGISVYRDPDNIFYYIAAATSKKAPTGMYQYEIPATTWVVFENDGHFKEVYPIIHGKPIYGHSEVWIAVKKEKEK